MTGEKSRRPLVLLAVLAAAAAVIATVLLVALGSDPEPDAAGGGRKLPTLSFVEDAGARRPAVGSAGTATADHGVGSAAPAPGISPAPRPLRTQPPRALAPVTGTATATAPPQQPPELGQPTISAALQAVEPAVKRCYERAREGEPALRGEALFRFTIVARGGRGRVASPTMTSSDLRNPALEDCLLGALRGVTFEAPGADGSKTLDFPIKLGPLGRRR